MSGPDAGALRRGAVRLRLVPWLTAVWVALWGDVAVGTLLGGAAVALGVVTAFRDDLEHLSLRVRPLAALRFVGYFAVQLLESNRVVAVEIVTPPLHIREGIVAVALQGASPGLVTLVANAVTLTPGTLTLEVDRRDDGYVLYVHVLHLRTVEEVRRDVRTLEYLAVRAFGSSAAAAAARDPRSAEPDQLRAGAPGPTEA